MLKMSEKRLLSVVDSVLQDIDNNRGTYSNFLNSPEPYVMSLTRTLSTFDGLRFGVEFFISKPVVEPREALYMTTTFPHGIDVKCYQIVEGSAGGADIWVNPFELSNTHKDGIFSILSQLLMVREHCGITLSQELENANIYEIAYFVSFIRVTLLFRRQYRFDKNRPAATADALVQIVEDLKAAFTYIVRVSNTIPEAFHEALVNHANDTFYRKIVDSCEPPPMKVVSVATVKKRLKADIPMDLPTVLMVRHNKKDIEAATNPHKPAKLKRRVDL